MEIVRTKVMALINTMSVIQFEQLQQLVDLINKRGVITMTTIFNRFKQSASTSDGDDSDVDIGIWFWH